MVFISFNQSIFIIVTDSESMLGAENTDIIKDPLEGTDNESTYQTVNNSIIIPGNKNTKTMQCSTSHCPVHKFKLYELKST
jgi:hypothetical protein